MSKIQEKLDSLQPYIVGIRYIQGAQVVDAVFTQGWAVPNSEFINKKLVDSEENYYMFYTEKEGITIDDLLDYVEGIIKINIEREKKNELLRVKVEELKKIFKENSLTRLEKLKFTIGDPDVVSSVIDYDVGIDEVSVELPESIKQGTLSKEVSVPPMVEGIVETPEYKETPVVESTPIAEPIVRSPSNKEMANVKGQKVELPPKGKKIKLEEFVAVEDKCGPECGPNDICPGCVDEKGF